MILKNCFWRKVLTINNLEARLGIDPSPWLLYLPRNSLNVTRNPVTPSITKAFCVSRKICQYLFTNRPLSFHNFPISFCWSFCWRVILANMVTLFHGSLGSSLSQHRSDALMTCDCRVDAFWLPCVSLVVLYTVSYTVGHPNFHNVSSSSHLRMEARVGIGQFTVYLPSLFRHKYMIFHQ